MHEAKVVIAKAGFEIQSEAEEADVVLLGFGLVEYSQDGNGCVQVHLRAVYKKQSVCKRFILSQGL